MVSKFIICLQNKDFRDFWANQVPWFHEFIVAVYENFNCESENIHNCIEYTDEYFLNKYRKIPDFILSYEIMPKMNNSSKKILITEDLHNVGENVYRDFFTNSDFILSRFNLIPEIFGNEFKSKIVDFPLYCSDIFKATQINFNSKDKIFFYGQIESDNYIYRKEWYNYFISNYYSKFVYNYEPVEKTVQNMNQYSFGFTSTYLNSFVKNKCNKSYFIGKFFEIPGAGLLLLADVSYVEDFIKKYGFIDGVNFISINKENADSVISFLYNPENKERINNIRINGYNLVHNFHTMKNRIDTLKQIIN